MQGIFGGKGETERGLRRKAVIRHSVGRGEPDEISLKRGM